MAASFERYGLVPVEGGSFRQPLELLTARLGDRNALLVARGPGGAADSRRIEASNDFYPLQSSPSGDVTGEVAFAGYGLAGTGKHPYGYANLDGAGRLMVVLDGSPAERDAETAERALLVTKARLARERGAAALLVVRTRPSGRGGFRTAWPEPEHRSVRSTRYFLPDAVLPLPVVWVSPSVAGELLGAGPDGKTWSVDALRDRASRPVPGFQVRGRLATLTVDVRHDPVMSHNVLGMVRGSDAAAAREVVVVGAHLDHDGLDAERRVFNGADDNASGTAGVLEIAEAFARSAAAGRRPRRPLVFALWNAEEKGLLGSRAYVAHPLPAGSTPVANLNLDMVGRSEEVPPGNNARFRGLAPATAASNARVLHVLGYSYSPQLAALVDAANTEVGLELRMRYDRNPIDLLRRSDHWPFLERGIPALFFTTGLHPDYHTPQDDVDRIEWEKLEKVARLVYRTAWILADSDTRPAFVPPEP